MLVFTNCGALPSVRSVISWVVFNPILPPLRASVILAKAISCATVLSSSGTFDSQRRACAVVIFIKYLYQYDIIFLLVQPPALRFCGFTASPAGTPVPFMKRPCLSRFNCCEVSTVTVSLLSSSKLFSSPASLCSIITASRRRFAFCASLLVGVGVQSLVGAVGSFTSVCVFSVISALYQKAPRCCYSRSLLRFRVPV